MRLAMACSGLLVALLLGAPAWARAQETDRSDAERDREIAELRRQLDVVLDELDRLRTTTAVPEEPELESAYGLGPGASKVYGASHGLSIGGYAEAVYRNRSGDVDGDGQDVADFVRAVLYFGYKFSDSILFNTELEYEHAGTGGGGDVSVELATLDFLLTPSLNARAGLLLVPMGFVNEVHEPPFYLGTQRPEFERRIIPSTWRENGVGVFGRFGESFSYRAYVLNGLDATGFSSAGLRGGRQKGSEALAEDLAGVVRMDWDPVPGLRLGGSAYYGNSGQDQDFTQPISTLTVAVPGTPTRIWEVHSEWRRGPLQMRALYGEARLSDAAELSTALELATGEPIAEQMIGGYAEIGYDLMQWLSPGSEQGLIPFFRFEYVDAQHDVPRGFQRDRSQPRRLFIPGIHYKPHPNVVLKLDYRNIDDWEGEAGDEVSVGFGLVF